jgi:hypothetical protein
MTRHKEKEELVAQLRDPETKGHRGTIVWNLYDGKYDCTDILDDLITCVIDGSFEEVQHATDIIERTITDAFFGPDGQPFLDKRIALLRKAITEGRVGDWRREAVDECLAIFQGGP